MARKQTRQPAVPTFWVRAPLVGARLKEVTLLLNSEVA